MPYLQLDVTDHYSVEDKRRLALKMSETYARMMSVDIRRISVAIRELGDGGVWRIPEAGEEPTPVAVMMLDIRKAGHPNCVWMWPKRCARTASKFLACVKTGSTSNSPSIPGMRCITRRWVAIARSGRRGSSKANYA